MNMHLIFENHKNKLVWAYFTLKILYCERHFLSINLKFFIILLIFKYADVLYGPNITTDYKRKIQKVKSLDLRFIYGIHKRQRISYKLKPIEWLTMENRIHHVLHVCSIKLKQKNIIGRLHITPIHKLGVGFRIEMYQQSLTYKKFKLYISLSPQLKSLNINKFRSSIIRLNKQYIRKITFSFAKLSFVTGCLN